MANFDRYDYAFGELADEGLPESPWQLFEPWLDAAMHSGVVEPLAMHLATVDEDQRPSGRMVLLRGWSETGLQFFSNYRSRKGCQIQQNPFGALTFWWGPLERQVRIEGSIRQLPPEESDRYFESRPLESRLASAASPQSQPVPSRKFLEEAVDQLRSTEGDSPQRPAHWGGYVLAPDRFEFWQGRPARLHDRIEYRLQGEAWIRQRLAP